MIPWGSLFIAFGWFCAGLSLGRWGPRRTLVKDDAMHGLALLSLNAAASVTRSLRSSLDAANERNRELENVLRELVAAIDSDNILNVHYGQGGPFRFVEAVAAVRVLVGQ